jgi:hypothetical protein
MKWLYQFKYHIILFVGVMLGMAVGYAMAMQ